MLCTAPWLTLRAQNTFFMSHIVTSYKFYAGNTEGKGANINRTNSYLYSLGLDSEYKFSAFAGLGAGLYYERNAFSLKQSSDKLFPNPMLHKKEFLITDGIVPEIFFTFYLTKKAETGLTLKLAASADYVLGRKHRMLDTAAPQAGFKETETKYYDVDFLSKVHFASKVVFGYKSFAVSIGYRFSDIIAPNYRNSMPVEFPKLSIGLSTSILFIDR